MSYALGRRAFFLSVSVLSVAALVIFYSLPVIAQEETIAEIEGEVLEDIVEYVPAGTVSCFDHYEFGSVQVDLAPSVASVVSGAPIAFSGTIHNNNPYPIVDGTVYVKIFHYYTQDKNVIGPDVVDQQVVLSDITIPANGSVPASFTWQVPAFAESGDYALGTYFLTSRKTNLLGLSFTDDVVGNTIPFRIVGDAISGVGFDKASITVNEQPYAFASAPPILGSAEPITIEARVGNPTSREQRATVYWQVYQWDSQLRENVVQESSENITIPANRTVPVSLTVTDAKYPVYLAVGTLIWQDTRNIINVRFVREGVDRVRLNMPTLLSYPLRAGEENALFSCVNNTGLSDVISGGRLELTLSDTRGNVIHSYTYTGDITGAMMGVQDSFTPNWTYGDVILEARLYDANGFVDEARLMYNCADIDPASCSLVSEPRLTPFSAIFNSPWVSVVVVAIALLLILGAAYVTRRSRPLPEQVEQI